MAWFTGKLWDFRDLHMYKDYLVEHFEKESIYLSIMQF